MAPIVFLDFDGVLHPCFPREDLSDEENMFFSSRPELERALRQIPETLIVISSSWREIYSLETLKAHFSADIALRIVGVTPSGTRRHGHGARQEEVEAFLAQRGWADRPWVAIDDQPVWFRPGATVVVCPDGFGPAQADQLLEAVRDPEAFARRYPVAGEPEAVLVLPPGCAP